MEAGRKGKIFLFGIQIIRWDFLGDGGSVLWWLILCQFDWAAGNPETFSNIILGASIFEWD